VITLIDYGIGNVGSVANMIRHCGGRSTIVSSPDEIAAASRLMLPGIGHFDAGMQALKATGIDAAIREAVCTRGASILGICLGMQLLLDGSEEGDVPGLGLVPGFNRRLTGEGIRIPHMGWTVVHPARETPLFDMSGDERRFYFVHSYHAECADANDVAGVSEYGQPFTSALVRGNVMGVQFHPEKSHRFGIQLFRRLLASADAR
jgi:glutamine amidotransferase